MKSLAIAAIALVVAIAIPSTAFAACTFSSSGSTDSTLTCTTGSGSAPTADTDGVALGPIGQGFAVIVSADSGQTLSGAGTLLAYVYSGAVGRWIRCADLDITVGTSGVRDLTFNAIWVAGRKGRVAFVPSSVTVSSGGVTVFIN